MTPLHDSGDPQPPLPNWIQSVYHVLRESVVTSSDGIRYEDALTRLEEEVDDSEQGTDIEFALKRLLDRGYLYEVDDKLRITEPRNSDDPEEFD